MAVVEHHVGDLVASSADERERGGHVLAQRLEGAQQDRQPLALHRLSDEEDAQLARIPRSWDALGSHASTRSSDALSSSASGTWTPLGMMR